MNRGMSEFVEKARGDEELRKQILEVEEAAGRELDRSTQAIKALAVSEGFDISDWSQRVRAELSSEEESEFAAWCPSTCCWVGTSVCCVVEE